MKKYFIPFLFICFICLTNFGFAQLNNIRFDLLSIENGLSQTMPNTVYQDKKGFIWIGTQDGLNLYDGYKFKVFHNDPDDSLSLCDNFIHCVTEDANGLLWVGTENGLCFYNRLDNHFKKIDFNKNFNDSKRSNVINTILFDKNKNLWIGTDGGGLYQIKFNSYTKPDEQYVVKHYSITSDVKLSDDVVHCLLEDGNKIMVGTQSGGLTIIDTEKNTSFFINVQSKEPNGISGNKVSSISIDNKKKLLFIGTENGLDILHLKNYHLQRTVNSLVGLADNEITCLLTDRENDLWIGTTNGLDKLNLSSGRLWHYFNQPSNPRSLVDNKIESLFEDNSGIIWVGTAQGLNKFDRVKQNFTTYRHIENNPNSLASDNIWSLFQDKKGIFWVGTDFGVDKIDRKENIIKHYYYSPEQKQKTSSTYKIIEWQNHFLVASDHGVYQFFPETSEFTLLKSKDNSYKTLNNKRSYSLFEDHNKNLWISTREGLLLFENVTQKFKLFSNDPTNPKSLPYNVVRMVFMDLNNNFYAATNGGGFSHFIPITSKSGEINEVVFENYRNIPGNKQSLNNNNVLTIYQTHDTLLWIGTYGGGLNSFNLHTKEFHHYTEKDGLSNNAIYGIIPDKQGNLWLSTNRGISCFNPTTKIFQNYYEQDGIQSNEFNTGAYSAGYSGEIMFGGIKGFNVFYPAKFKRNLTPPTPTLTGLWILNKEILPGKNSPISTNISDASEINLNYRENSFTLDFSALHFSNPNNNRYNYILEGVDEEWNIVGNKNYASYTKLDAGEYVFKLRAANSDGVWSKKDLEVKINILPPYWKTMWFRVFIFLSIALMLWLAYRTRINLIREQKKYLEKQIKERTQKIWQQKEEIETKNTELEKEKNKVEKLLLNILPTETVDELKNKGKAQARHYRTASVMFSDFKGFTLKSEKLRPQELVEVLDFYFIKFDEIIAKYNIEKIKTIGDAYMAAGGVPIRNKSNPIDLILAGLEIQQFVKQVKEERLKTDEVFFECRIGIHTGEIIAGVVGIKRFAYDIWGDTVNVASRMEASSEVGKVNVSGVTYQVAKEFFTCTHRGKIQAKNKGEIDMYFVESIRPELSVDGKGIIPNEAFADRLEHILYSKINYKKAEHFIVKLLDSKLPPGLFYHGLHHTLDVCKSVEEIALAEGIDGEDLHILKTAALFHDAGFTKQYTANEVIGCEMANETLPQFGYSPKQIKMVEELILATIVPQNPKNHLEQIICDADLDYLGRNAEEFYSIAQTLFEELKAFGKINDPIKWDEIQVNFLSAHKYFTKTNVERRRDSKVKRIEEIKNRLSKLKDNNANPST